MQASSLGKPHHPDDVFVRELHDANRIANRIGESFARLFIDGDEMPSRDSESRCTSKKQRNKQRLEQCAHADSVELLHVQNMVDSAKQSGFLRTG